jgi:hypothetical protein
MTPVTGCIANADQYWFVLCPRLFKGLFSPGIPIYGVMGMLQQIRAGLLGKTVGIRVHSSKVDEGFRDFEI